MTTTIEKPPEDTPATAEADEPLPEYAAAVSELGDPQPTIDELTADLDASGDRPGPGRRQHREVRRGRGR